MSNKYIFYQSRASSVLLAIRSADFLVGNSGEWGKKWNQVSGASGQKKSQACNGRCEGVAEGDATANPLRQSRQLSSQATQQLDYSRSLTLDTLWTLTWVLITSRISVLYDEQRGGMSRHQLEVRTRTGCTSGTCSSST